MLTTTDLLSRLELHGRTPRDRGAELFIPSVFARLVQTLMTETFVAMLVSSDRARSTEGDFEIGDRVVFAGKTLRDCHAAWFLDEGDGSDQDGIGFFQFLARATPPDIRFRMSREVEAFWASRGLLEDGGFMRTLAPAIEAIRPLIEENGAGDPATAARQ